MVGISPIRQIRFLFGDKTTSWGCSGLLGTGLLKGLVGRHILADGIMRTLLCRRFSTVYHLEDLPSDCP